LIARRARGDLGVFNQRHKRYGHLFQGRFAARVIEGDRRRDVRQYVVENPERAGLRNWPWVAVLETSF
jgi:hypothetical protein